MRARTCFGKRAARSTRTMRNRIIRRSSASPFFSIHREVARNLEKSARKFMRYRGGETSTEMSSLPRGLRQAHCKCQEVRARRGRAGAMGQFAQVPSHSPTRASIRLDFGVRALDFQLDVAIVRVDLDRRLARRLFGMGYRIETFHEQHAARSVGEQPSLPRSKYLLAGRGQSARARGEPNGTLALEALERPPNRRSR